MTAADPQRSPNHQFLIDAVLANGGTGQRVLDFGCGSGFFVAKARAAGLDAYGIDRHDGFWSYWRDHLHPGAAPYVARTENGEPLPYPPATFDAVVSNQVFEHIPPADIAHSVDEIARVLKPGGLFLAIFPTSDVWFEGHVGLYFAHRLTRWPALQRAYLRACHTIGLGYYREASAASWGTARQRLFSDGTIVYHRARDFRCLLEATFHTPPTSLEADNMRFRLSQTRLSRLASIGALSPVLRFVHIKRAGRIFVTYLSDRALGAPQEWR